MLSARLCIRSLSLILFTAFCVLLVLVFYYITPKRQWSYFVKMWANVTTRLIGIKISGGDTQNPYFENNTLVIANHISWMDIPILYTQHSLSFVGRMEMKQWPILSLMIKSGGTIFINRECKRDLIHVNRIVSQSLISGGSIGLFPEGKTGSGLKLMPFKSALFEAPIMAKSTIVPLVIQYYTTDGKITTAPTYEGNNTLWQSLSRSLKLPGGMIVKITPLQRIDAGSFSNREELAGYLHQQFNQTLTGVST